MRCPKCHYISFDAGDRCRNCGYQFSLSVDLAALDLPIKKEPEGPLADFGLSDMPSVSQPPAQDDSTARPRPKTAGLDLPLFKDRAVDDDTPLVTPPAVPRAPLAVRKGAPVVTRAPQRARVDEPELDLGLPDAEAEIEAEDEDTRDPGARVTIAAEADGDAVPAPLARRFGAALVDGIILGAIDLAVLYFTLKLCGLRLDEVMEIPAIPFLSFLLLQNGGYFVAFVTAGGQTIGKMALNIKVVPAQLTDGWSDRVPLGTAVLRAVLWFLTVLPLGIGLLPAVFSADHRAVHDRLADTRVVRA